MVVRVSNGVHLEVLEDVPTERTGVHLEVYDKAALATMVADITDAAENIRFTAPLGPDSMLTFRIHRDHPKAVYIERGNLIKARYNGIYVNPSWFITGDPTVELAEHPSDEVIDVECISAFEYLDEFVLRNEEISPGQIGDPWSQLADGRWFWDPPQPPAAIVVRQFEEAQTAGYLPDLTYDFDRVIDSQNNPWPEKVAFEENVGAGFAGVVRKLMALGFEGQMRHDLLFQAFVEYGRHFEDTVVFGPGNIYRRERPAGTSKLRSRMLVVGKAPLIIEVVDPVIETQLGHPVIGSMRFDSDDPTTLDRVGKAALRQLAEEKDALTLPVRHGSGPGELEPFIDYRQGDWVGHHRDGSIAPESRRILAITVTQANGTAEPEIELELDAIVLTPEQRRNRQLQVISGAVGVSSARPSLGAALPSTGTGAAHPDLAAHDALGLSTDAELAAHAAAANPHPGYATDGDLSAHAGAADPHPGYTTPAEVVTAIAAAEVAHEAEADPHAGYQKESEKGAAGGYASLDGSGTVPDAQIPAAIARDTELHAQDHASRHASGAADAVKLDDLATPDDNTDLNVSTTRHGLAPKLPNDATKYFDGTGAYSVPAGGGGGGGGAPSFLYSTKAAADTPDDEMTGALPGKWAVVAGAAAAVALLEAGNVARYDRATRAGAMLFQVGSAATQEVLLRQDFTIPDGSSIIAAIAPSLHWDVMTENELQIGLSLNSDDSNFNAGAVHAEFYAAEVDAATGPDLQWASAGHAAGSAGFTLPIRMVAVGRFVFLRIARGGLWYYPSISLDGHAWVPFGATQFGAAPNNLWLFCRAAGATGTPVPIHAVAWVRQGGNGIDPWPWA